MHTLVGPRVSASVSLVLGAWFVVALAGALVGAATRIGPALGPIGIVGGVGLGLLAHRALPAVRAWAQRVDLRWLVYYQSLRAPIGAGFLWLHAQGRLPVEFATVAGWGDIAAGLWALAAAACLPADTSGRRRFVLLWNAAGLLDILIVVATAQRMILWLGRRDMFEAFVETPALVLLPLFVVPTVILAHLLVFARLGRGLTGSGRGG